jgi:hypothetical protein
MLSVKGSRGSLLTSSVVLSVASLVSSLVAPAIAVEPPVDSTGTTDTLQDIKIYQNRLDSSSETPTSMQQVTSVSQLSDVQPTDWAFQALQSLVERYGCIAGYPNRTYRGNRAMTRYEFAAGLNACMDRVNELIASATADLVTKEDLAAIKKLQDEFAAEMATLKGRVDGLEAKVKTLEAQQFSTTTKLSGEVIFAVSNAFSSPRDINDETVFQSRVRLNLLTSFTGKDRLRTRLQSSNASALQTGATTGTNVGQFSYNVGPLLGHQVYVDILDYQFPIGKKVTALVMANGALHHYYADTVNPLLEGNGGGNGALSKFGERNPIYRIGAAGAAGIAGGGSGIGFNIKPNSFVRFDLGYISNTAQSPTQDFGLFGGNYSALAQAVFQPTKNAKIGLTYVRSYDDAGTFTYGGVGTRQAALVGTGRPVEANSFGLQASWRVTPKFQIGAWGGYTDATFTSGTGNPQIWNYGGSFAFPDLLKKGALAALIVGAEPYRADIAQNDVPLHVEAFYKYPVNNRITITPGIIWVTAPDQNKNTDDVVIGTVRTTFTF